MESFDFFFLEWDVTIFGENIFRICINPVQATKHRNNPDYVSSHAGSNSSRQPNIPCWLHDLYFLYNSCTCTKIKRSPWQQRARKGDLQDSMHLKFSNLVPWFRCDVSIWRAIMHGLITMIELPAWLLACVIRDPCTENTSFLFALLFRRFGEYLGQVDSSSSSGTSGSARAFSFRRWSILASRSNQY